MPNIDCFSVKMHGNFDFSISYEKVGSKDLVSLSQNFLRYVQRDPLIHLFFISKYNVIPSSYTSKRRNTSFNHIKKPQNSVFTVLEIPSNVR